MLRSNQPFEDPASPALPFRWAAALLAALVPLPIAFAVIVLLGEALFQLCPRELLEQYRCTAIWYAPASGTLAALVIAVTAYFFVALPTRLAPSCQSLVARSVSVLGVAFYLMLFAAGAATTIWPFAVWLVGCAATAYFVSRRYAHAA